MYLQAREPRPWTAPLRAWRVLAGRRGIIPTPLLYLIVAGIGLVIGVVLQVTVGVWWWLPPLVLLMFAWLVFFTSIWWHPGARAGSLRVELLTAANPRRGFEARRREQREQMRASGLPLFELESWPGSVRLAGWGGPTGRITHVSVGFFDEPDTPPVVTTSTVAEEAEHEDRMRDRLLDELSGIDLEQRTGPSPSPEAIRAGLDQARDELRGVNWTPTTICIDGREHPGHELRAPSAAAAYCAVGDLWVTITATAHADYRLCTITDPARILDAA